MPSDVKYLLTLLLTLGLGALWSYCEKANLASRWNSCDAQISTIQALIERQPAPSNDIVFLGASSTMNGIDVPELNRLLKSRAMACVNLGVNWFGHEMQLSILEAWLERHQPQKVVVEVPMLYRYYLHPHYTFLQSPLAQKAMWTSAPHRAIIPTFCQGPRRLLQSLLPATVFAQPLAQRCANGGTYFVEQGDREVEQSFLAAQRLLSKSPQILSETSTLQDAYRNFRYAPEFSFLTAIAQLCGDKNIPFVFLAMPGCGFQTIEPELLKFYQGLAPVWSPPYDLLQKPELWRDAGHLNGKGAKVLADWLGQKIGE